MRLLRLGKTARADDYRQWDQDGFDSRDEEDLKAAVALAMNAAESMTAAARITGDGRSISISLESAGAAVREIERKVADVSANADATSETIGEAVQIAHQNYERMDETSRSSKLAVEALTRTDDVTNALLTGVGDIRGFVRSIGEIAGKTSMLAINASIEAARAGEAGKGFAVVASQVQALSSQTQQVTEDISKLITDLSERVDHLTETVTSAAETVGKTAELSQQTASDLQSMCAHMDDGMSRVKSVCSALSEQSAAMSQISDNILEVSVASQTTAARAETLIAQMRQSEKAIKDRLDALQGRSIKDYDLHRAKADPGFWKQNLSEMLVGLAPVRETDIPTLQTSALGKWYSSVSDLAIKNHPAYAAMASPHKALHRHAKEAAGAIATGSVDEAIFAIEKMEDASVKLIRCLDELLAR